MLGIGLYGMTPARDPNSDFNTIFIDSFVWVVIDVRRFLLKMMLFHMGIESG